MRNVVILAAGQGSRYQSKRNKLAHRILGKPVITYVVDVAKAVSDKQVVVISPNDPSVPEVLSGVTFAYQEKRLGTADAVKAGLAHVDGGTLLVLLGDTPCLKEETLEKFYKFHQKYHMDMSVLSVDMPNPKGYGRIIRDGADFIGIVDESDATSGQKHIKEVNTGVILFDVEKLKKHIGDVKPENEQGEYYLTDMVEIFHKLGYRTGAYRLRDYQETIGINTRAHLAQATKVIKQRINEKWMIHGVTMTDPDQVYIEETVVIGKDVFIEPGTILKGDTVIEDECHIGPFTEIINSTLKQGATVMQSKIMDSVIGEETTVGPYAYIRPNSHIGKACKIGDFVEIKNTTIGDKTKVPHLAYVGDADLGSGINVGCGAVFVNYDGKNKHRSQVQDGSFIGCNSNIVAPVVIGKGAYVAAATVVTKEVPEDTFVINKQTQSHDKQWKAKKGFDK